VFVVAAFTLVAVLKMFNVEIAVDGGQVLSFQPWVLPLLCSLGVRSPVPKGKKAIAKRLRTTRTRKNRQIETARQMIPSDP